MQQSWLGNISLIACLNVAAYNFYAEEVHKHIVAVRCKPQTHLLSFADTPLPCWDQRCIYLRCVFLQVGGYDGLFEENDVVSMISDQEYGAYQQY